jgi:broad specificity phosphatase PhoE
MDSLKKSFRLLFRSDFTRDQAQAELEARGLGRDPYVMELLDFLRAVDLGKHGRSREGQRPGVPLEKRDGSMSFKAESVPQGDSAQD